MGRRCTTRLAFTLALACSACAGSRDDVGDDQASTGETEADTSGCFGCPCTSEGACDPGLECVNAVCELRDGDPSDEGGGLSSCGFNPANEWYDCGFSGEDPSATFPRACPAIELRDGDPCPAELSFAGCCDDNDNLWFCDQQTKFRDC